MKGFLKHNFLIVFLYLVALTISLDILSKYDKVAIHLYLNQFVGHPFWDSFFYYITYLGDGVMAVVILLGLLLYNVRSSIYAACAVISASLCSTLLKFQFFSDANRPSFVFKYFERIPLKIVEGTDLYIHNSFPSGHSTQAFCILMCIAFITPNKFVKVLLFFMALLTAFSRMYLSQHWLEDITAGSFIGMSFSILFYFVFIHKNTLPKLNKPLFQLKSH